METTADLVKVTIEGAGDFTAAIEKRGGEIVSGAIEAATEVGGDLFMTIKSTVHGIVKAGSDVGTHGSKVVRDALTTSIKGTQDVIKQPPE